MDPLEQYLTVLLKHLCPDLSFAKDLFQWLCCYAQSEFSLSSNILHLTLKIIFCYVVI